MEYKDCYLNCNQIFANSENVLRFNIQIFNKYISLVGNYSHEAPDMAFLSMRECLDSMRRLGTKSLFDVISNLIGTRIKQLKDRDSRDLSYLDRMSTEKGIEFLENFQEMFDILRTRKV